jgi:hypothetical protein
MRAECLTGRCLAPRVTLRQDDPVVFSEEAVVRTKARGAIAGVVAFIVVAGAALAGDALTSGLKPGDSASEFIVMDITGPAAGTSICYRCRFRDSPVVCVFARKPSESVVRLVKQLDAKIDEKKSVRSFVVFVAPKGEITAGALRTLAADARLVSVILTICENPDGPPEYHLSKDADVTVLMWRRGIVKAGRAFKGALSDQDIQAILSDVPTILSN